MSRRLALLLPVLSILVPAMVHADGFAPEHAAPTVTLTVDATEAPRKLFRAREVIPASPGPLTLHYPKWLPASTGRRGRSSTCRG